MDHGLAEIGQYYEVINESVIAVPLRTFIAKSGAMSWPTPRCGEGLAAAHVRRDHENPMTKGGAA
jgi:hypothetical protein